MCNFKTMKCTSLLCLPLARHNGQAKTQILCRSRLLQPIPLTINTPVCNSGFNSLFEFTSQRWFTTQVVITVYWFLYLQYGLP